MEKGLTTIERARMAQKPITADLFSRFIAYLDAKPKTVQTYTRALRQFFSYLQAQGVTQPTRETVLEYREHLAQSRKPSTVQAYIVAVRLFFRWTEQEGLYRNVADHVKGAKLDRQHKKDYLTSGQLGSVLDSVNRDNIQGLRDYAIIALMSIAGLRTIEVSRANIEDMRATGDFTVLYIQGKGRDERTEFVKIPQEVETAIRAYLKARGSATPQEPLFVSTSNNNHGQRMTTRSISGIVKARLEAAGYSSDRLTAHSLRHTAVTLSLIGGATIQEAQQFARHNNISTTQIYAHNLDKEKNPCAGIVAAAIFR